MSQLHVSPPIVIPAQAGTHGVTSADSSFCQITYDDCYPAASINEAMKEDFNQTAIRTDGQFGHDKVALYADTAKDSYSIVVFLDPETLVPKPTEPLVCLLDQPHDYGYAAFTQSKEYGFFFPKR